MESVILLVGAETTGSDRFGIGFGSVGIRIGKAGSRIGMIGSRIGMVGFVIILIRFKGFITHSLDTHTNWGQCVVEVDRTGFET